MPGTVCTLGDPGNELKGFYSTFFSFFFTHLLSWLDYTFASWFTVKFDDCSRFSSKAVRRSRGTIRQFNWDNVLTWFSEQWTLSVIRPHAGGTETQGAEFKIIRDGGDAMSTAVHQQRFANSLMFKVTSVPLFSHILWLSLNLAKSFSLCARS